jgi:hypothetical protein
MNRPTVQLATESPRCPVCHGTGRVLKPSTMLPGRTVEGYCPTCTPHFDFSRRVFVNCDRPHNAHGKAA